MSKLLFTPNIKQWQAMCAPQKYVGYGGARGGGKSYFVRMKAITMAQKYPGISICIVRATFDELEKNHIRPLRNLLMHQATYNQSQHLFTFPNGSTIKMDYFALDKHADHFQGIEYDLIFLDEATNFKPEWLQTYFQPCIRGVNAFPKHIYYTCNPGGVGHSYIKRVFIDRQFQAYEKPEDYVFIQAKVTDNLALMRSMPEYVHQLEALPPKKRKAWLDGDWDVFEGQFFEEFVDDPAHYQDHRWTHVIEPFKRIPKGWNIYRSFDWGYSKPFSVGWWAIDYNGILYRIRELYGCSRVNGQVEPDTGVKWQADQIFERMQEIERTDPYLKGRRICGPADNAIFSNDTGPSISEVASKYGIHWDRSDKQRVLGWQQCHARLHFDENGYPMMYVFNTCKDFIRTIPGLQYDEHDPEDLDTHGEDHIADEWRYMCMFRPIKPIEPEEVYTPSFGSDPLNQYA